MRKILAFMVVVTALLLTGCGSNIKQVENVESVPASNGDIRDFLSVGTEQQGKSTEEVFSISGPLVKREIIQNELGQVIQISNYEYDDRNRYSRVETVQYVAETGNIESSYVDEYSYDEFFLYHTQTVWGERSKTSYDVRDTYNNIILLRVDNGSDSRTVTYTYDYTCDTNLRHEEYCYSGEGLNFSHYIVKSYNKMGDEISCVIQDSDDEYVIYSTEYEYDSEQRIRKSTMTRTEEKNSYYTLFNKIDVYIREYTYNNSGLLEKEIYTVITDKDSYGESESMSSITYEYDKENRLIKEIHDGTNAQTIIYEYDEETVSGNGIVCSYY